MRQDNNRGRKLQRSVRSVAVLLAFIGTAHADDKKEPLHAAQHAAAKPVAVAERPHEVPHAAAGNATHHEIAQERHEIAREHHEIAREHRELAQNRREIARERHEFHERDVHRFSHEESARWHGGRWNNTCYGGRCGWWWFAGGQWYFYGKPTYPYPLVVSEVNYLEPVVALPVAAAVALPLVQAPPMLVPPPPRFLYYCDNPAGYYPQVSSCASNFREVAAPPAPR